MPGCRHRATECVAEREGEWCTGTRTAPLAICWDVGGDEEDGNVREGGRKMWLTFVLFLRPLLPSIQMYL